MTTLTPPLLVRAPLPTAATLAQATDPRELGCRCDECGLGAWHRKRGSWRPVMPEIHSGHEAIAVVAEAPGGDEVVRGRPLVGKSGGITMNALAVHGVSRPDVVLDNAVCCQPPLNEMKKFRLQIARENKRLSAEGRTLLLDPVEACRPHVLARARVTPNLLLLGNTAYEGLFGASRAIRTVRGSFIERWLEDTGDPWRPSLWRPTEGAEQVHAPQGAVHLRITPTVHPAFVLRASVWEPVLHQDVGRFLRWIGGRLNWTMPKYVVAPSPAELERFLYDPTAMFHAADIETGGTTRKEGRKTKVVIDARDVARCYLRCLAIATPEFGMVIPFRSIRGDKTLDGRGELWEEWDPRFKTMIQRQPGAYYSRDDGNAIVALLRRWICDPSRLKIGHNWGSFDDAVLHRVLALPTHTASLFDTILGFRANHSDLPRDLYTLGTLYTDVSDWKSNADEKRKIAKDPRSDAELWLYNHTDAVVTAAVATPLATGAAARGQQYALRVDHAVQGYGREMRRLGLFVDQAKRKEFEDDLVTKITGVKARIRDLVGEEGFNPGSTQALGKLLYTAWNLPILAMTDGGEPAVDDATLRKLILHKVLSEAQDELIRSIRSYRKWSKQLGTYVLKLRPGILVDPRTGRVHPNYNVATPVTGRISSSGPNCFDSSTELLTEQGWIAFDALLEQHRNGITHSVAQWDKDSGSITFAPPTAYHEGPYTGEMVRLKHQATDLYATEGHRVPLKHRKGRSKTIAAGELTSWSRNDWSTLHAGMYAGGVGVDLTADEIRLLVALQIRLLVALQADGHIRSDGYGVDWGFYKQRKIDRTRDLLNRLGLHYSEYGPNEAGRVVFYVRRGGIERIIDLLGPHKEFGPWVLKMSRAQMDVFLEEIWLWDGWAEGQSQYASTSTTNVAWVQTLLVLSGQRANIRYYQSGMGSYAWVVDRKGSTTNAFTHKAEVSTEQVKDLLVYCVTMPTGYIVVRRNGRAQIVGQSQNFPKILRNMIIPAPGHVFIGADYDQIELRLFSAMARIEKYLAVFREKGGDPHAITALALYGKTFEVELAKYKASKTAANPKGEKTKLFDALRRLAKVFIYAVLYGGTAKTIWESVSSAEDDDGKLLFPGMELREVRAIYNMFMANLPEVPAWWEQTWAFTKLHGYITEPVLGRRRDFPTFERNECLNMPIQGAAAAIMGLGLINLVERLPFEFGGPYTGLINQCHDAALVEAPEKDAERVRVAVEEAMYMKFAHLAGVEFTAAAVVAHSWDKS